MLARERSCDDGVCAVEPIVHFALSLSDDESDPVSVRAELEDAAGAHAIVLSEHSLPTSPTTEVHALSWDAARDFGTLAYRSGLRLLLYLDDGKSGERRIESNVFAFGNDAPELTTFALDQDIVSGLAIMRFAVRDSAADTVRIKSLELSTDGFASDAQLIPLSSGATGTLPSGTIDVIATSTDGLTHSLAWNSQLTHPNDLPHVLLRLTLEDDFGGTTTLTTDRAFALDNANTPPSVRFDDTPSGTVGGNAAFTYTLEDIDGDSLVLVAEVGVDSDTSGSIDASEWQPASSASQIVGLHSGAHEFIWTTQQLPPGLYPLVRLRLLVSDGRAISPVVESPAFAVDTSGGTPRVNIESVAAVQRLTRRVPLSFTVNDADGDTVDFVIEYERFDDAGNPIGAPRPATVLESVDGVLTPFNPTLRAASNTRYDLLWDALADADDGGLSAHDVVTAIDGSLSRVLDHHARVGLRVRATDSTNASDLRLSPRFALGTRSPRVLLTVPAGPYNDDVPLEFQITDPEGDSVEFTLGFELTAECDPSALAMNVYTNATSVLPVPPNYETTADNDVDPAIDGNDGVRHGFVWRSSAAYPGGVGRSVCPGVSLRGVVREPLYDIGNTSPPFVAARFGDVVALDTHTLSTGIANQSPPLLVSGGFVQSDIAPIAQGLAIRYTLIDNELDPVDIRPEFSLDNGYHWTLCRELADPRSEGTRDLTTSPIDGSARPGIEHLFVWDLSSLPLAPQAEPRVRIWVSDGKNPSHALYDLGRAPSVTPVESQSCTLGACPALPAAQSPFASGVYQRVGSTSRPNGTATLIVVDMNGDGRYEVIGTSSTYAMQLYSQDQNPDGTPSLHFSFQSSIAHTSASLFRTDLNADGSDEVVGLNSAGAGTLRMFTASGAPLTFATQIIALPSTPVASACENAFGVQSADLDNDGHRDLVVSCSNGLRILWGDGTLTPTMGPFVAKPTLTAGTEGSYGSYRGTVLLDWNGDGILDLVAINSGFPGTSVFDQRYQGVFVHENLGAPGARTFAVGTHWRLPMPESTLEVQALAGSADLDADGLTDFVARFTGGFVGVYLTRRGQSPTLVPKLTSLGSARLVDVNGDAVPDLIGQYTNRLWLHFGAEIRETENAPSSFLPGHAIDLDVSDPLDVNLTHTPTVRALAARDVDGDGQAEVFLIDDIITSGTAGLVVLTSAPARAPARQRFSSKTLVSNDAISRVVGITAFDANQDGIDDWLTARGAGSGAVPAVLEGLGVGGIHSREWKLGHVGTKASSVGRAQVADFNGDGALDYEIANTANNHTLYFADVEGGVATGAFTEMASTLTTAVASNATRIDADARDDFATATNTGTVELKLGQPTGFTTCSTTAAADPNTRSIVATDVDDDDDIDLVILRSTSAALLRNTGAGGCSGASVVNFAYEALPLLDALGVPLDTTNLTLAFNALDIVDVDLDGSIDFVTYNSHGADPRLIVFSFRNSPSPALVQSWTSATLGDLHIATTSSVYARDVNLDGAIDVIYSHSFNSADGRPGVVRKSTPTGMSFGAPTALATDATDSAYIAGFSSSFAIDDIDGDGRIDLGYLTTSEQMYLWFNAARGSLQPETSLLRRVATTSLQGDELVGDDGAGVDRFTAPYVARIEKRILSVDAKGKAFAEEVRSARQKGELADVAGRLRPLTLAYRLRGDKRLARVVDPAPPVDEPSPRRMRIEHRFGPLQPDGTRSGLSFAEGRHVVIDLPVLTTHADGDIGASNVRLVQREEDWTRANDPALSADVWSLADVGGRGTFLPKVLRPNGSYGDVYQPRPSYRLLTRVSEGEFIGATGPRYSVITSVPNRRFVRIATESLGDFQAFLVE